MVGTVDTFTKGSPEHRKWWSTPGPAEFVWQTRVLKLAIDYLVRRAVSLNHTSTGQIPVFTACALSPFGS